MQKRNLHLAAISGLVTALAMPWPGLWPLAWVGLVPLLCVLRGSQIRSGALCGAVFGAVYFGVVMHWLLIFGFLPWLIAAVVATPVYVALFGAVATRLMPDRVGTWGYFLVPAAWTAVQWLRSLGPAGLTWGSLAHTQANSTGILQIASLLGPWAIDFLVCAFNLALAGTLLSTSSRRFTPLVVTTAVVLFAFGWGNYEVRREITAADALSVAVVQGNLPQGGPIDQAFIDLAITRYSDMTAEAAQGGAEIIVWPETTLPVRVDASWDALLSSIAERHSATIIVGGYDAPESPSEKRGYNSAHVYDSTGHKLGVYHKVQLVPYGEYVPLRKQMPWLERYGIRAVDVLPGQTHNAIDTGVGKVGICICFESLFPAIARAEVKDGAQFLVVMTNDSWFLRTQAARGHLMMSQLRAVENRRYVVRAAATGISTIIDPYGRSTGELGIFERGLVKGRIHLADTSTLYTRLGDAFAYLCALAALVGVLAAVRNPLKRPA